MNLPDFFFEKKLWNKGYKVVAGIDEVGRGCFAGPVVAACAAFAPNSNFQFPISNELSNEIVINDSKLLTPKQRELADKWIRKNALAVGIGQASVAQINRFGIKKASEIAFRGAIRVANKKLEDRKVKSENEAREMKSDFPHRTSINYLLIDAFYIPYVKGLRRRNQLPIIKGDTKSVSIAAASIIAKVYRDKLMTSLSKKPGFKKYKWGKNKGYGTREHRNAIQKYGIARLHRKSFVETFLKNYEDRIGKMESRQASA